MARVLAVVALLSLVHARLLTPRTAPFESQLLGLEQMDTSGSVAGPTPMFTEKTMPKVSPALQCVMGLSMQYFIIYTVLAIIRTGNQFTNNAHLGAQKILETACTTVTYAPMLCVLFLAARMRAIQLTQGETEKYKMPQPWAQTAMFCCVYAVLGQVIIVLIIPILTHEAEVSTDEHGNLDLSHVESGGMVATILSAARYIIMLALYGGFTTVIVAVFMMKGPKEIWGNEPPTATSVDGVSPAVMSTIFLTTMFFTVYFLVAVCKTTVELSGRTPFITKLEGTLVLARYTVNFCPMLAILFIGTRMRALQIDPKHGNPQRWAQMCFYGCTASVCVQTILVIIMPFCSECECEEGLSEGDVVFKMENQSLAGVITGIRYLALLALYGGFTAVICSIFLISHPTDVSLTPPISPAMQCVMNLTLQYFTIYLVLFVCITVKQFTNMEILGYIISIFEAARMTVMFAPMLSMLFIGARMRALQLTKATDGTIPTTAGPQTWVQDGMYLATWSVLVQLIMSILVPICTGTGKPEMDHSGNVKTPEGTGKYAGYAIETVRYLCLVAMYGGIVTVMVGIYLMTPETLPPYSDEGSLVPEQEVPLTEHTPVGEVKVGGDVPKPVAPPTKAEAEAQGLTF